MTNRISRYLPEASTSRPQLQADRRLKRDVDAMLRDLAFVMKMTERVKSQILEDRESTDALSA
jgi:hypothetical protein